MSLGKLRGMGAAAAAAGLITACGSQGPDRQNRTRDVTRSIETMSSRVTEATALGTSIPFIGNAATGSYRESRELVSVVRVIEPAAVARLSGARRGAAAGSRLLAVELSIEDIGPPTYRGNPGRDTSLISENTGGHVGRRVSGVVGSGLCARNLMRPIALESGQRARGCVFFEIPITQRVSAIQYETQGGTGQNIATWAVHRSAVHG
jgi:hypothetical protein